MEAYSARPLTNICRSEIGKQSLIKHKEINFESILSIMYVKDMSNLHTHNTHSLGFIWGFKVL